MALNDYLKGDASTAKAPGNDQDWAQNNPGPYFGIVKGNSDPTRMGRLSVFIPSIAKVQSGKVAENQLITCEYLSPFYGAKDAQKTNGASRQYKDSQHSYGFWGVPPDIETKVLVIFAEGKMDQAYWIGCIQDPYTNQMVPGIASSTNTWDKSTGQQEGPPGTEQSTVDKVRTYGSQNVPAGELNRRTPGALANGNYEGTKLPIHPFAEVLVKQGLSADDTRGNTSSSARRESPSQVFGISTPGRKDTGTTREPVGPKDSGNSDYVVRTPGHTFTMDDGAEDGTNQLTRLRTASGHQLLMHDTAGIVYIANGSGNAWIEMNSDGKIDLYSGVGGINMRTQGDFNLHSDANINMHAAGSIRMSAETDMVQSASALFNIGEKGIFNASHGGSIRDYARDGLSSFTPGQQLHGAGGAIHLAGAQVHFNSTGASPTWGPEWLTTDKVGMTPREEGDVELAQKGMKPLQSFTKKTKTTVHRFVTHEPMPRFKGFTSEGVLPSTDPNDDRLDTKQWSRLSRTPGTVEFMEQNNRVSPIESIRLGQFQADSEKYLQTKMGSSTNAVKARELITEFGDKYDDTFNILNQAKGKFAEVESISNKLRNFSLSDSVDDVTKNITTQLSNQVVDSVTGSTAVQMFKDNVFVNNVGELYSLRGGGADLGTVLATGNKIVGDLNIESLQSVTDNVAVVTNVYKNVVSGNLTNVVQSAAVSYVQNQAVGYLKNTAIAKSVTAAGKKAISSFVGKGALSRGAALHGSPLAATGFASVLKSVGAISLGGGSTVATVATAVGSFFEGFSDVRLKEDIELIGKSPAGINIYSFKYKQLPGRYIGVMAQEVPWAREMTDTGFYMVDYSKVDVEFRKLN